jgi:hypothetical protein
MTGRGPRFLRLGKGLYGRVFYKEEDVVSWLAEQPTFTSTAQERQHLLNRRNGAVAWTREEAVPSRRNTADGSTVILGGTRKTSAKPKEGKATHGVHELTTESEETARKSTDRGDEA